MLSSVSEQVSFPTTFLNFLAEGQKEKKKSGGLETQQVHQQDHSTATCSLRQTTAPPAGHYQEHSHSHSHTLPGERRGWERSQRGERLKHRYVSSYLRGRVLQCVNTHPVHQQHTHWRAAGRVCEEETGSVRWKVGYRPFVWVRYICSLWVRTVSCGDRFSIELWASECVVCGKHVSTEIWSDMQLIKSHSEQKHECDPLWALKSVESLIYQAMCKILFLI